MDVWSLPRTRLWQFRDLIREHIWSDQQLLGEFHRLMQEQAEAVTCLDVREAEAAWNAQQAWIRDLPEHAEVRLQVFDHPHKPTRVLIRVLDDASLPESKLAEHRYALRLEDSELDEIEPLIEAALDDGRCLLADVLTKDDLHRRAWSNATALAALLPAP